MFKKVAFLAFVGAVAASNGALAGTDTKTMAVSADVQALCTLSTAPLNFGTLNSTTTNTDVSVNASVTCSSASTPYTLNIDYGANAQGTTRRMKLGTTFLPYEVYTTGFGLDAYVQTPGTAGSPGTSGGTGTGTVPIFGRIPAQATPATGVYTDTLAVVINY
jgi:spore coat protein U-like protein